MSTLSDLHPNDKNDSKHSISNGDDDASSGQGGKTKVDSESKFRANRFLRVHFHILKALYEQESSGQTTSGDCVVEKKYWNDIECFLTERNTLQRATKRAQRMREIHDEAVEFQKTLPPLSIASNHIISHQVSPQFKRYANRPADSKGSRPNFKFGSSALMLITQPSPCYLPNRQPVGWSGRRCHSGGRRNPNRTLDAFHEDQRTVNEDDGGNAFGIVSGLLRRKHSLASRHLNRRTSQLRLLVKECRSRIETLNSRFTSEIEKEKFNFRDSGKNIENFVMTKEEFEDRQVRIETKIRLWKLLLHDLLGTVSVHS